MLHSIIAHNIDESFDVNILTSRHNRSYYTIKGKNGIWAVVNYDEPHNVVTFQNSETDELHSMWMETERNLNTTF